MGPKETIVIVIMVLAYCAVILFPVARILRRTGYSPWLAIAALIPLANVALLWFIAASPWTADQAGVPAALPPRRSALSFFRAMRERIQLVGLPQKP
jgi:hypothetical protein